MNLPLRILAPAIAFALAAGAVGGWAGVRYGLARTQPLGLHASLHELLTLTPQQDTQIHGLELRFSAEREKWEAEMRAANADLAAAIMTHSPDRDRAQRAVERFHGAMGALQTATIDHVLAMRAILTPAQALQFDGMVARALLAETP